MASPAKKSKINTEKFPRKSRTYIFIHFKLQQRQLAGQLERVQRQQIELVLAAQRQVVLDRRRAVPERERYLPMVVLAFVLRNRKGEVLLNNQSFELPNRESLV